MIGFDRSPEGDPMATDSPKPMSPTTAVVRHLEWLEFALVAARDEELRRRGRLDRATDKNREKRIVRLAEVTAEVLELAALVKGIKDLQAGTAGPARKPRATKRPSGTIRRNPGATTRGTAGAAVAPAALTAAPKARPAAKARPTPITRPAAKARPASKTPKAPAPKKRPASGSKPAGTRARRSPAAAKPSAASAPAASATAPTGPTA
jgi:hypothetical protein